MQVDAKKQRNYYNFFSLLQLLWPDIIVKAVKGIKAIRHVRVAMYYGRVIIVLSIQEHLMLES